METPGQVEITKLLMDWGDGKIEALDHLLPLVYAELKRMAARHMNREGPGISLQTTALVHEAYLRLVNQDAVDWQSRAHFFGICAQLMRQILVDHARARQRVKRGGGAFHLDLDENIAAVTGDAEDILALNDAVDRLHAFDQRKARVVELRFFGGLDVKETAEVLKISENSVIRDWRLARAWLQKELQTGV
jgi:RNA polymerase sigma factor (TIGR02999 family)